jgi:hypothetical protein
VRAASLRRPLIWNVNPHLRRVVWVENASSGYRTTRQTGVSMSHRPLWGCGLPTCCCLRGYVDYSAARLPECLRCMPLRLLRSGVIDHVPLGSFLFWLVDSARRMGEPRTPLAVDGHCRSGSHRQCRPSAEMQRVGARHSPQGSKMARSILV